MGQIIYGDSSPKKAGGMESMCLGMLQRLSLSGLVEGCLFGAWGWEWSWVLIRLVRLVPVVGNAISLT
jgi:hypothetical protein